MASLALHAFPRFCSLAFVLLPATLAIGTTAGTKDEIRAPGLACFPVPARSSIGCRAEVIPGISYSFWYSPPRSPSNLTDEEIHRQFHAEISRYQRITIAYAALQDLKHELENRQALSAREEKAVSDIEDKYSGFRYPFSGDGKGVSTKVLHARLRDSIKAYEENIARLERIRELLNLMVSRRALGPNQSQELVVFAERYDLVHEAFQAVVDEIHMSAAALLDENENLRDALKDAAQSSSKLSNSFHPVIHNGLQLGSLLAKPSEESLTIAVPGNQALFTTFKPLTNNIVDDQSIYAIRLTLDPPKVKGFQARMNRETPEVQLIARHGSLGYATWQVDVQADGRFGQAQLVFHGKLLHYTDEQAFSRRDKPDESDIELPIRAVTLTPVPTEIETKLAHLFGWIEHFFGALGAPITFLLALVSVYTNRAKIQTFWKWLIKKTRVEKKTAKAGRG